MKFVLARFACEVAAAGALAAALAAPAAADDFTARLFGRAPGKGATYACFTRVYDEAHLKGHPQQNVRAMYALAKIDSDFPNSYDVRIGSYFRNIKGRLDTEGSCGMEAAPSDEYGAKTMHCGVACDGGSIDVAVQDNGSLLIGIPERARLWRPGDDMPNSVHGAFGPDDKLFRLDRAKPAACLPLADDAADRREIARAK